MQCKMKDRGMRIERRNLELRFRTTGMSNKYICILKNVLRKGLLILLSFFYTLNSFCQYYIRGDVKDEKGLALQNVKIYRPSTKGIYSTGQTGGFGIPSSSRTDSLIFTKDGFDSVCIRFKTDEYQNIVLKIRTAVEKPIVQKMTSFTTGNEENGDRITVYRGETYSNRVENEFVKTSAGMQTTFGLRIDKASYSNIRRFINQNVEVPPDAVRLEEMFNYFNLHYTAPFPGDKFHISSQLTDCPWNADHRLLFINLSSPKINTENLPPSNFVFLIDVSGSMDLPNRLPLLKESFQLLVKNLREQDTVSIVVYGGTVGVWLTPTGGSEKEKIIKSIEELEAYGDTPGESAIRTAYKLAKSTYIPGGNNRIILATDGDFNIGVRSEEELEKLVTKEKENGIYLTCLGVGMGNYKDSKIEVLAKKGNGNFAYIDNIAEGEKVLVQQFTQTMYTVANDVYFNIKFNPEIIKEYRLLGYDNRKIPFKNYISVPEGGELGSGSVNTIIFEIKPADSDIQMKNKMAGSFNLHYKEPDDTTSLYQSDSIPYNYTVFSSIDSSLRFYASLAMFGLKLKNSAFLPETSWDAIRTIAVQSANPNNFLQRQFIELIDKCKKVYNTRKRRRN